MLDAHVELLGEDLGERRGDARAELHFPREQGDGAVGADGEPRIETAGARVARPLSPERRRPAERDDHCASRFQEVTA